MEYTEEQKQQIKELETEMKGKYLTEKWLGEILKVLYPNNTWEHDKKLEPHKFRPDYCCHELKLCVEFDGPDHYTKSKVIHSDILKDTAIETMKYKIIRIPYFIQLNTEIIKLLFDIDIEFDYGFKHGFISRSVTLPADFCEQGIWRFKDDLLKFKIIKDQIKESILKKVEALSMDLEMAKLLVAPSSLFLDLGLTNVDYESEQNKLIISSNLNDNWNCVILENCQTLLNIDGIYNMKYNYDKGGNISGFSFMFKNGININKYGISIERIPDDKPFVDIIIKKDDEIINEEVDFPTTINVFNLSNYIFAEF